MGIRLHEGREFEPGRSAAQVVINGRSRRRSGPTAARSGRRSASATRRAPHGHRRHGHAPARAASIANGRCSSCRSRPQHYERPLTLVARTAGPPATLVRPVAEARAGRRPERGDAVREDDGAADGGAAMAVPHAELAVLDLRRAGAHARDRRPRRRGDSRGEPAVREFGVRMSIGATPRDLMRDVLTGSIWLLAPGLIDRPAARRRCGPPGAGDLHRRQRAESDQLSGGRAPAGGDRGAGMPRARRARVASGSADRAQIRVMLDACLSG